MERAAAEVEEPEVDSLPAQVDLVAELALDLADQPVVVQPQVVVDLLVEDVAQPEVDLPVEIVVGLSQQRVVRQPAVDLAVD